ncbi:MULTISPECIES: hypothetical protein [unclassified Microbacterium]|uniref:hypothetical protein n=1 Tax=unclassified Microbacterium TaxID=2609290 RepID=UPI000EAA1908|nr:MULTISPECIES: hypothetical protein [unclassified Microbacterium]MBT2485407.1 hypothetical protein [Microbacterium sp. ISL-108]RKN68209.1 hypothetical protein D7252_11855 [Microbacterium sp. CGR2]
MDEQQPELRWAPLPAPPKRKGRIWLIVGLVVAALVIVGALLFFLLPRGESPDPGTSGSPTPAATASGTPSPSSSPSTAPEPTETPITTAPPVADPTVEVFRDKVSGWLSSATRGLDIVSGASGQDALPVVETLQDDAQRLSDTPPPASIQQDWSDGVTAYAQRLTDLRSAIEGDSGVAAAVDAARASAQTLKSLVGL